VFETLEEALGPGSRRLAVDLGAGSGQATGALARRFEKVIAVEPDARMLGEFPSVDNVSILNGAAEEVSLPNGSIDAAISATAFHWMDQRRVIANVYDFLRPGGVFFPFLYDAVEIEGAAAASHRRCAALWAPYKDRRLIEAVDYTKVFAAASARFKVRPFASGMRADVPAKTAAGLLGTASFVNAYVQAKGLDIRDYVREMATDFARFGPTVMLVAPLRGVVAVKSNS
jgi:SAM-dependent methyltransferase